MTREEKIEYMLNDLAQKGIGRYTAAPPLHRLLWRLGFDVAPPPFATFWSNALLMGVSFAVAWAVIMWLAVWRDLPLISALIVSGVTGAFVGLSTAAYYRWRWRKLGLPHWGDYPAAPGKPGAPTARINPLKNPRGETQ
jgi:hypothetical protein